jgi:hypothetical protein
VRDRISQAEIVSFANAAVELWRQTGYPFVRMHDVVTWVWTDGNTDIKLPPAATQEYYRKIGAVRKQLIDEGHLVCPVVDDYARKVKVSVFAEEDAQRCLPRKGAPLAGFLFVGEDSSDRDLMIWAEWLRAERKVSNARGSEAAESVTSAQRKGLTARPEVRWLFEVDGGGSTEGAA